LSERALESRFGGTSGKEEFRGGVGFFEYTGAVPPSEQADNEFDDQLACIPAILKKLVPIDILYRLLYFICI
jgi:hypothetical protein